MANRHAVKGNKYETELAAYINEHTGLSSFRTPLSGGGFTWLPQLADLMGTPELHIEAKRTERPQILKALEQAEEAISKTSADETPIVITRKNLMPIEKSLCVMRLEDFVQLYGSYLQREGHTKENK